MPDMPRLNLDEVINKVFWPNFLKVVLPFLIAGLIFVIIRLLFRRALWDMPKTKMIVDFVLALIFLLVCAVFVVPLVRHLIETTEIPDDDYNMVVNADGTPYEFHDPFEWFDMASGIEFHDPFDPENWPDMASHIEFHDPFDPESWTDIVSGAESDASTRSGDYDASLTE